MKLRRNLYVGLGTFGSTFVGNMVEDHVPGGDAGVGVANVVVGTGLSVGSDMVFQNRQSFPNDIVEFAGYGIAGSGWAEIADELRASQTGGRAVNVSVGQDIRRRPSRQSQQRQTTDREREEVFLDSA